MSNLLEGKGVETFFYNINEFRHGPFVSVGGDIDKITVFDGDNVGMANEEARLTQYFFNVLTVILEKGVVLKEMGGVVLDSNWFVI